MDDWRKSMIGCGLMKWACDADEGERRRELKRQNREMRAELKRSLLMEIDSRIRFDLLEPNLPEEERIFISTGCD